MRIKFFIIILCFFLCSLLLFLGIAYVFSKENLIGVDVPKDDVPYIDGKYIPNNCVLLVDINGNGLIFEILFSLNQINVALLPSSNPQEARNHGYYYTHTLSCDYNFVAEFIDSLGGISYADSSDYTLTGVQVCDLIQSNNISADTAKKILSAIFIKISNYGFSSSSLYCIIEKTDTDLSSPFCYGWCEILGDVCKNYTIKDER